MTYEELVLEHGTPQEKAKKYMSDFRKTLPIMYVDSIKKMICETIDEKSGDDIRYWNEVKAEVVEY